MCFCHVETVQKEDLFRFAWDIFPCSSLVVPNVIAGKSRTKRLSLVDELQKSRVINAPCFIGNTKIKAWPEM